MHESYGHLCGIGPPPAPCSPAAGRPGALSRCGQANTQEVNDPRERVLLESVSSLPAVRRANTLSSCGHPSDPGAVALLHSERGRLGGEGQELRAWGEDSDSPEPPSASVSVASLEDRSPFTQDNDRWSRCCYRERRGRGRVRGQGCRPPRGLTCLDSEATGPRWGWGQTAASCRKVEEPGQLGADALRKHRRFETPRRGFHEQRPHPRHRLPAPRSFWPWRA